MVAQRADDLRRICGVTRYWPGLGDNVELVGIALDRVPAALDILGMPDTQASATLMPNKRRWVCKVVHYWI